VEWKLDRGLNLTAICKARPIRYGCQAVPLPSPKPLCFARILPPLATMLAVLAMLPMPAAADGPDLLLRQKRLCNQEQSFCLNGTVLYYPNSRVIELSGRVARAPGPGWVSILFRGSDRNNYPNTTAMEFAVRGDHSEIVDRAFIPDYPQVRYWRIIGMTFEADPEAREAARDQ